MTAKEQTELTLALKAEASRLGFSACGIAQAGPVDPDDWKHYTQWIEEGNQASMHYLENYPDKRHDPSQLMEGAQTLVSVALNYYPKRKLEDHQLQFAWYAYGKDYHTVVKERLEQLLAVLQQRFPEQHIEGRAFCDTAPLLERYWAWRCGLGWIGKNNLLILPHHGSTFFLGELLLNIQLDTDVPMKNRCGNCNRCIEACPTQALSTHHLNANRCLSYLTIESREELPEWAKNKMDSCIYGCDRCLQACPWNRFATPTGIEEFAPSEAFLQMTPQDWQNLTVEQYRTLFKGSAVKRAKYEGLMRNIKK